MCAMNDYVNTHDGKRCFFSILYKILEKRKLFLGCTNFLCEGEYFRGKSDRLGKKW